MLSRRSTEINHVLFANVGEDVFYGGEQAMFITIVMRLNPFPFQYSPKSFGDVEVRGVRREIEYVEASVLPCADYAPAAISRSVSQSSYPVRLESFDPMHYPLVRLSCPCACSCIAQAIRFA